MERRKDNLGADGELADYNSSDFGRVTPFSCYVRTLCDQSPDKLNPDQRKKMIENWKKLQPQFKQYYIEQANKKCEGNWYEEELNEYTLIKRNVKAQKKMPHSELHTIHNARSQEFKLEDLIKKINSSLILSMKATPTDMDRWSYLSVDNLPN